MTSYYLHLALNLRAQTGNMRLKKSQSVDHSIRQKCQSVRVQSPPWILLQRQIPKITSKLGAKSCQNLSQTCQNPPYLESVLDSIHPVSCLFREVQRHLNWFHSIRTLHQTGEVPLQVCQVTGQLVQLFGVFLEG